MLNKRGQVAIFVIVALLIVGGIVVIVTFRDSIFGTTIPAELQPVFDRYSKCLQEESERGIDLLSNQGGRIFLEDSGVGNDYSPFTKNLNFYGVSVPYWYRLNQNGFIEENVPSISSMEQELAQLIEERLNDCDLSDFYQQGFYIDLPDKISASVSISKGSVQVEVKGNLGVVKEDLSAFKEDYNLNVQSRLGEFYDASKKIYDNEIQTNFIEQYSLDVLRLYSPVDGVEIQCTPKIWKSREVVSDLQQGIESNLGAVKFQGADFSLANKEDKYFVVDSGTNVPVRLVYSKDWPSVFEIDGDRVNQELMIADPIGNQEGLGVLGFCYVPYHFVYDLRFPVMVQIGDGLDLFQFPVTAIIDNNLAKKADLNSLDYGESNVNICDFREGNAVIHTYDENLNSIEADVSYQCLDQLCDLGRTTLQGGDSVLETKIPICLNGRIIAKADGYSDAEQLFSSNSESVGDLILEKEYEVNVNVLLGGKNLQDQAIVYFEGESGGASAVLPGNEKVKLKEGNYDVKVYVYGNSGITIPASSKRQCINVARGGLAGFFGSTKEECFNIQIPESKIDRALKGGGTESTYILTDELSSGRINLEVQEFPNPTSLEQLQYNYELFNDGGVGISFG